MPSAVMIEIEMMMPEVWGQLVSVIVGCMLYDDVAAGENVECDYRHREPVDKDIKVMSDILKRHEAFPI